MAKEINIKNLEFTHFVVARFEKIIFASAKEGKRIRNFILDTGGKWAKYQTNGHFEYLPKEFAWEIAKIAQDYYTKVPVYHTKTL